MVLILLIFVTPCHAIEKRVAIDMSQFDRVKGMWAVANILQKNNNDQRIDFEYINGEIVADVPLLFDLQGLITPVNIQAEIDAEAAARAAAIQARRQREEREKNDLYQKHNLDDTDINVLRRLLGVES